MTSGTPSGPRPLHPFSIRNLSCSFQALQQHSTANNVEAPYAKYQREAEKNILELSRRLVHGEYAPPSLRPTATISGRRELIAVEELEDRIVQRSVARLLMASYQEQSLTSSYGLNSTQSKDALRRMAGVLRSHPVTWILPPQIESCGDDTVRKMLIHDLDERIADKRVLDLITRWIDIGVHEVGRLLKNEVQAVTGQPVLTLLGDIYFHLALDIWFEQMAKTPLKGRSQVIRFVGEAILCFEEKCDADEVVNLLGKRLSEFGLVLDIEKTRLIECRGDAAELFCFLGSWFPSARHEDDGPALHEEASSSPEPSIPGQGESTPPSTLAVVPLSDRTTPGGESAQVPKDESSLGRSHSADMNSNSQFPQWRSVPCSSITLHNDTYNLYAQQGQGNLEWPDGYLTPRGIERMAIYLPIHVVPAQDNPDGYRCFAGVRLLQAAAKNLPPDHKLDVVVHSFVSETQLREAAEMELDILRIWHRQKEGDRTDMEEKYMRSESLNGLRNSVDKKEKEKWQNILKVSPKTLDKRLDLVPEKA